MSLRGKKGREFAEPAILIVSGYSISTSSVSPCRYTFLHREIVARSRADSRFDGVCLASGPHRTKSFIETLLKLRYSSAFLSAKLDRVAQSFYDGRDGGKTRDRVPLRDAGARWWCAARVRGRDARRGCAIDDARSVLRSAHWARTLSSLRGRSIDGFGRAKKRRSAAHWH